MGAALTYARRYALFTLVGIAGEDDLDAPDLNLKVEPVSNDGAAVDTQQVAASGPMSLDNGKPAPKSSSTRKDVRPAAPTLGPEQSAALRERLIADLAHLTSEDEAADWVHQNLPVKNALVIGDAELVEASFRERLAIIEQQSVQPERRVDDATNEGAVAGSEDSFCRFL